MEFQVKVEGLKVWTPKFRASFVNVFTPKANQQGKLNYSICMLFDKDTDISVLKQAAAAAKLKKWGANPPKGLRSPFRDGNEKSYNGFENVVFINAKRDPKDGAPEVVDALKQPIVHPNEFYSGCYARATIQAYAYDNSGNKGVGFALHNIQKLDDGEALSSVDRATNDFSAIAQNDLGTENSTALGMDF